MENITLKKISQALGISISTVSRALKDHPDISAATKKRVTELAQTLDYEPNANAINLRTKSKKVFGLMVPSVSNTFYDSFMSAVEEECRASGYSIIIMQSAEDPEQEKNIIRIYRQNQVAGIFACLSHNTKNLDAFHKIRDADVPVVFFDKVPDEECDKVCVADEEAAGMAAAELIRKSKKNILALFGNKNLSITKKRLKAFQESFKKNKDSKIHPEFVSSSDEARIVTDKYFSKSKKPDAVFCMSDEILTGAMKSLQQLQVSYPDQTGIISISDGYFPQLYYPEITFVETSGYKLGQLAFNYMMSKLRKEEFRLNSNVESKLIKGGSL